MFDLRGIGKVVLLVSTLLCMLTVGWYAKPAYAAAVPRINVEYAGSNGMIENHFFTKVSVFSAVPVEKVSVTVGDRSAVLAKIPGTCYSTCSYSGEADLTGLPKGPVTAVYRATDVDGNEGTVSLNLTLDNRPVVTLTAPLPYAVADPALPLDVACTDDDPAGCKSLKVFANAILLAQGTAAIHEGVSLDAFQGKQIRLRIVAEDGAGQTADTSFPMYVESNPELERIEHGGGLLLDSDADRILYWDAYHHRIKIRDRHTGHEQILPIPVPENRNLSVWLTPDGATGIALDATGLPLPDGYRDKGLDPYGKGITFEWRNGELLTLTGITGMQVRSGFAAYARTAAGAGSGKNELVVRNLQTREERIADTVQGTGFALAEQGSLAYVKSDQIYRYRFGDQTPQAVTADPQYRHSLPQTDGTIIVYTKTPAAGGATTVAFAADTGETAIPGTLENGYLVAGGHIAFVRKTETGARQLWIRSPEGIEQRVSPTGTADSRFDALAPDGSATYTYDGGLYYAPVRLGERLPGQRLMLDAGRSFWRDGWNVYLGAAWYRVKGTLPPDQPAEPTDLTVEAPEPFLLETGSEQALKVTAKYPDGTAKDVTADSRFDSADPAVAEVSEAGLVTGKAAGATAITVTYGKLTRSVPVTVRDRDPVPGTPDADLDGDGLVGIGDLLAFARAFGTSGGELHFDPRADVDGDGHIGIKDVLAYLALFR